VFEETAPLTGQNIVFGKIHLGWVNMIAYNVLASGPKFTNFSA